MFKGKFFDVAETPLELGSPENPPANPPENSPENSPLNPPENSPENPPENSPEPEPEVFMQTNNGGKRQSCRIAINQ